MPIPENLRPPFQLPPGGEQVAIALNILGGSKVLGSGTLSSEGFVSGSSGWRILGDGSVEFNSGTFRGTLDAAGGTFSGTLDAVDGTFTGTLSAVDGTFTGTLSGVDGTFVGTLSGGAIEGGTIDIGGSDATSFHVDSNGNMWLGDAAFASAPFSVANDGEVLIGDSSGHLITMDALSYAGYIRIYTGDGSEVLPAEIGSEDSPSINQPTLTIQGGSYHSSDVGPHINLSGPDPTVGDGSNSINIDAGGGIVTLTQDDGGVWVGSNGYFAVSESRIYFGGILGSTYPDDYIDHDDTNDSFDFYMEDGRRAAITWDGTDTRFYGPETNDYISINADETFDLVMTDTVEWTFESAKISAPGNIELEAGGSGFILLDSAGHCYMDAASGSACILREAGSNILTAALNASSETEIIMSGGPPSFPGGSDLYINGSNVIGLSSSRREHKKNIKPLPYDKAKELILATDPVSFDWKAKIAKDSNLHYTSALGYIVDDLAAFDPRLSRWHGEDFTTPDTTALLAAIHTVVKHLLEENDARQEVAA